MSRFRSCSLEQTYLLPPSVSEWLPEWHPARFIAEVVEQLDLSRIVGQYSRQDGRGALAYHPVMLVRLLLYAYSIGQPSSRRIERATYDDLAFRYLSADQHPDHDTIANFRQQHLEQLAELFTQGLRMCQLAGLGKVGKVLLDGTKMAANAARQQTRSLEQLTREEEMIRESVQQLLAQAAATDQAEDQQYGVGERGDELSVNLGSAQQRLERIRQARQELERRNQEKLEQAEKERAAQQASGQVRSEAQKKRYTRARQAVAERQGSINLTDADSRLMKAGNRGGYLQGYNAQAAVTEDQIIIAAEVTEQECDKQQLVPMVGRIREGLQAEPTAVVADTGYYSDEAVTDRTLGQVDLYVPPDRSRCGEPLKANAPVSPTAAAMRAKLWSEAGVELYRLRAQTVEPVFGQIKEVRGLRRFLFRGIGKVGCEWKLIALTHNLLKLYRHRNPRLTGKSPGRHRRSRTSAGPTGFVAHPYRCQRRRQPISAT
jgi:transposase